MLCDESTRQRMSLIFRLSSDCHGAPRDSEGNSLLCVSDGPFYGSSPLNHTHVLPLACTLPGSTNTVPSERRSICIDYLFKTSQKCAQIVVYAKHIFVNRSGLDLQVFWGSSHAVALNSRSLEPLILSDFEEADPTLQVRLATSFNLSALSRLHSFSQPIILTLVLPHPVRCSVILHTQPVSCSYPILCLSSTQPLCYSVGHTLNLPVFPLIGS